MEQYREYLRLLARLHIDPRAEGPGRPLGHGTANALTAIAKAGQFRGSTDAERGAWLRAILANHLAYAVRPVRPAGGRSGAPARGRPRPPPSARLEAILAADQSTPSEGAMRAEEAAAWPTPWPGYPTTNARHWSWVTPSRTCRSPRSVDSWAATRAGCRRAAPSGQQSPEGFDGRRAPTRQTADDRRSGSDRKVPGPTLGHVTAGGHVGGNPAAWVLPSSRSALEHVVSSEPLLLSM